MNGEAIQIGWVGYTVLVVLGVVSAGIVQAYTRGGGLKILWAQVRMSVQLVAMGFVLAAIFAHPRAWVSALAALVMTGFAVVTVVREHRGKVSRAALWRIGVALALGSALTCVIFVAGVVQVNPLVNPRYLLPLLGMILGNSMTGMNVAVRSMEAATRGQRLMIETAIYLGASKEAAMEPIAKEALGAALVPTLTTMFSLGIVMIPGMMTGQLLSGSLAMTAVAYQLAIMVGILFSVVISVFAAVKTSGRYMLADICD